MESLWLEIARYAQVILGISLVIFVHEAGHFLCARWCGVRVDVFSLGMGPRLFGWRRGSTMYQVALVPIGGYVRMAGEESSGAGGRPGSDELPAKSVGQRFLIYSGGVIANVVFGLVVFPIIFAVGVPCAEPILGPSTPGTPAWHAGLEPGTRVLSANGNKVFDFNHIVVDVALGSPEEAVLEVQDPGSSAPRTVRMKPVWAEEIGAYKIGVNPGIDARATIRVAPGSPAESAGLRTEDRLVTVEGGLPGLSLEDQVFLAFRDGRPFVGTFEREGKTFQVEVTPRESAEVEDRILGIMPLVNHLFDLRETPLSGRIGLRKDDRLLSAGDRPILREFDLVRALADARGPVTATVLRGVVAEKVELGPFTPSEVGELARDLAIGPDKSGTRVSVKPGSAAAKAGLVDGDRILSIDGHTMDGYMDVFEAAKAAKDGRTLVIEVERRPFGGEPSYHTVSASVGELHPFEYGFALQPAQYVYRTEGPVEAISAGLSASWKFLEESWLTLKRILLNQVSAKNIGGIITIGVVSHSWASLGLTKLFFFLCMLSMNLAFLNVLPIPVFDGGHLLFLLIEKIKGSPVSERVLSYSQMVGIVLIVSLMVWVTYSDVMKWFVRP